MAHQHDVGAILKSLKSGNVLREYLYRSPCVAGIIWLSRSLLWFFERRVDNSYGCVDYFMHGLVINTIGYGVFQKNDGITVRSGE